MTDAEQAKRRRIWYAIVAPAFVGLAAVLIAIGFGFAPGRLWPVAGFLMLWAVSAGYVALARRAYRRRLARVRSAPVPRDVRLATPIWIKVDHLLTMTCLFAMLGTLVAALGFPGVAVGILLVVGGLLVFGAVGYGFSISGVRALTFQDDGLRFHLRGAECLVPWRAIGEADCVGPDHYGTVRLTIVDVDGVLRAVSPDTARARARARSTFGQGMTLLEPWVAGLDGRTLARAITDGRDGVRDPVN